MCAAIWQGESHEQRFDPENFPEFGNDRDAAPFADERGVAVGDGLGEAFFRFGEVSGDGVGVGFFFRCLRVGVGDGSKAFLIFVPSDSSAARAAYGALNRIAIIRSHFMIEAARSWV